MRVSRAAVLTLLVGLLVTAGLATLGYVRNDQNESRLLRLQTQEAGAILQVVVPVIETPLSSAGQIAVTTSGDPTHFDKYIAPFVGTKGPFSSASLWEVTSTSARMVSEVGAQSLLGRDQDAAARFLADTVRKMALHVAGPLGLTASVPRLGYAFAAAAGNIAYVVYAESDLPPNRRAPIDNTSPLADLRFALYLGSQRTDANLLETNAKHLPIRGRTSKVSVPFGDQSLTLVATPARPLAGSISGSLWWMVAIFGVLFSIGAALAAERLTRRRMAAEQLTVEIRGLLGQQRTIAEALQRALLPEGTPSIEGTRIAARYFAGEHGLEIGGDWYDVIPLGTGRLIFDASDVSGRGVRAGSVMAALRFAIRGFVSEGHEPAAVLDRLGPVLDDVGDGLIATVLCGTVDVGGHLMELSTAGHPPPLLVDRDGGGDFVDVEIGPPIGVHQAGQYRSTMVRARPGSTLIAYTDGLIERRDESLDLGLERLRTVVRGGVGTAHETADSVIAALSDENSDDDTALLVIQWID